MIIFMKVNNCIHLRTPLQLIKTLTKSDEHKKENINMLVLWNGTLLSKERRFSLSIRL